MCRCQNYLFCVIGNNQWYCYNTTAKPQQQPRVPTLPGPGLGLSTHYLIAPLPGDDIMTPPLILHPGPSLSLASSTPGPGVVVASTMVTSRPRVTPMSPINKTWTHKITFMRNVPSPVFRVSFEKCLHAKWHEPGNFRNFCKMHRFWTSCQSASTRLFEEHK